MGRVPRKFRSIDVTVICREKREREREREREKIGEKGEENVRQNSVCIFQICMCVFETEKEGF